MPQYVVQIATIPMTYAESEPGKVMTVFVHAADEATAREKGAAALGHPAHDLTVTKYEGQ